MDIGGTTKLVEAIGEKDAVRTPNSGDAEISETANEGENAMVGDAKTDGDRATGLENANDGDVAKTGENAMEGENPNEGDIAMAPLGKATGEELTASGIASGTATDRDVVGAR